MEVNSNKIFITNESSKKLVIIVELIHFVVELSPMQVFEVIVKAKDDIKLVNFFDINYTEEEIVVFLNNDISKYGNYSLNFFLDGVSVYEGVL
ncbi:MAG: hypothetical protein NTW29_09050 [Bacteroidetes bacterium]|nr:hypothetical protein [Bacteroidota bacterium]